LKLSRILIRTSGLGATALGLFAAMGCGSGSTNIIHTTGNYSNASLNGTYVYAIHGDSLGGFYREVGAFTADGAGNITAGSDDSSFNSGGLPVTFTGSYTVGNDGTGFVTFSNSAVAQGGAITLAITLVSSSKVALMEADAFAFGGGTAELQTASAIAANPGTFVFRLHQESSAQSSSSSAAQVGLVNVSGSTVTGGTMDQNLGGVSSQLTLTGGTFGAPGTLGRGTATLTDSTPFTTSLIYYTVATGKMVLLVSNANAVGSGSAEAQTAPVSGGLSGNYAFGSTGDDAFSGGFFAGSATVGSLTASSGAISSYTFDTMQDGNYSNGTDSGTYASTANGRVAVTLNSGAPEVFWMVSPARAFFLINSASKTEDGTTDLQTVNSFSVSTMNGQFAMSMGGINLNFVNFVGDLSRIGPMNFNGSGKLTLAELVNDSSSGVGAQPPPGGGLSGTYQVDSSTGRIVGTLSNSGGGLDLIMYAVSGSDAYVLQPDTGTVTSGMVSLQH
jgi:hypothetical protein